MVLVKKRTDSELRIEASIPSQLFHFSNFTIINSPKCSPFHQDPTHTVSTTFVFHPPKRLQGRHPFFPRHCLLNFNPSHISGQTMKKNSYENRVYHFDGSSQQLVFQDIPIFNRKYINIHLIINRGPFLQPNC